jgi:hypothetical protein
MKKNSFSQRSVLGTLTTGVLGFPLVSSVSISMFGLAGTKEKHTAVEVPISVGNPDVPLMFEGGCGSSSIYSSQSQSKRLVGARSE